MESLGVVLKRYREEAKFTIASFSNMTKIQVKALQDLEDNGFDRLQGDLTIRSYIKQYSNYLGLDYQKLINLYEAQSGGKKVSAGDSMVNYKVPKAYITPKILKIIGIVLAALVLFAYLAYQVSIIFASPFLTVTTPDQNLVVTEKFVEVRGQTEKEAQLYINDKQIFTDANGYFQVTLDLLPGINLIKVSAKKKYSKESVVFRQILLQ